MDRDNQLLDPIGTMCKLIALCFSKFKTKIKISDHVLTLDSPNDFQGVIRWYYGDGKENISELYYVITRIIKWYLVRDPNMVSPDTEDFEYEYENIYFDNDDGDDDEDDDEKDNEDNEDDSDDESHFGFDLFDMDVATDDDDEDDEDDDNNESNGDGKDMDKDRSNNFNSKKNKIKKRVKKQSRVGKIFARNKTSSIANSEELRVMIQYLCKALSKLQETYEFGNVVFTLQYFIGLLQGALEGQYDESKLPEFLVEMEKNTENLIDYGKMKTIWRLKDLSTICRLYKECFKIKEDDEISHDVKNNLIKGHLKTINLTLKITDKKFRKLMLNSKRG
jgi:hypothetical protein